MEKNVLSLPEYQAKAARYAAAAEHCESEVRDKLYQWQCPSAWMDTIIDYLYDNNYLNDERYCHAFVHDKFTYQSWGPVKIKAMLSAKRLPSALIQKALLDIDENDLDRTLNHLIEQKKSTGRERLVRFLLQRGFTYEQIRSKISLSDLTD